MKKLAIAAAIAMLSPLAHAATVNFDTLKAASAPVGGATLANYLASYGIVITNMTAGGTLYVYNDNGGTTVDASPGPNYITAGGNADGMSYTINFAGPQAYFEFTRAELNSATSSGVTHPEWTATALDANGHTVATASEPLMASFGTIPAKTYKLIGAKGSLPIVAVVIYGNAEDFAGFATPVLENWVLPSVAVPVAGTVEGVSGPSVTCQDLTTGQTVTSGLSTTGNFTTFNCYEAGLTSNKGDSISITITGTGSD